MILHLHDPSNELQRLTSPSLLMLGLVELVNIVETNKMNEVEVDVAWNLELRHSHNWQARRDDRECLFLLTIPLPKVYKIYHRNVWKNTYVQERFCPPSLQAVELSGFYPCNSIRRRLECDTILSPCGQQYMMEWIVFVRTGICIGILGTRKELRLQVEMSSKSSGVEFHAVQVRVMRRQLAPSTDSGAQPLQIFWEVHLRWY